MIEKNIIFIATLCIVNASLNIIDSYEGDGLSIAADAVYDELDHDLTLIEDVEDSIIGTAKLKLDPADSNKEEKIRICRFNICSRVCRALNLRGKCVKKRCKCIPKGLMNAADGEPENAGLNLIENVEGLRLKPAHFSNEEKIRLCNSSICNRLCRVLKLKGKCVKKRCKCLPTASSMIEDPGFMVDDGVKNFNWISDEY